jgi:hypothetical protein
LLLEDVIGVDIGLTGRAADLEVVPDQRFSGVYLASVYEGVEVCKGFFKGQLTSFDNAFGKGDAL